MDLSTNDGSGASIPIVAANMTAVSGRRMAETIARCGGLAVIPQDIPVEVVTEVVSWIKQRHPIYDTPLVLTPTGTVGEALNLLPKRGHGAVIVVDKGRAGRGGDRRRLRRASTGSPSSKRDVARAPDAAGRDRCRGRLQPAARRAGIGWRRWSTATGRSSAS